MQFISLILSFSLVTLVVLSCAVIALRLYKHSRIYINLLRVWVIIQGSFIVILLPYLLTYGSFLHVPGPAVNDAVTHAVLGRSCADNQLVRQYYFVDSSIPCVSGYPNAGHILIWLLSVLSGLESSKVVHFASLYMTAWSSVFFFWVLKKLLPQLNWQWHGIMATVLPSSYLLAVTAYHGFFPQSASLVFVLFALAFVAYSLQNGVFQRWRYLVAALLIAAAGLIYSVVALLPIVVFYASAALIYRRSREKIQFLILTALLATVLFLIHPGGFTQAHAFLSRNAAQSWYASSQDSGHLAGFVSPLVVAGIWLEPDYRYESPGITRIAEYAISVTMLMLAAAGCWFCVKKKQFWLLLPVGALLLTIAGTYFVTNSPYSVLKIVYYLSPFILVLAVYGGFMLLKRAEIVFLTSIVLLIAISAQHLVQAIGGTPFYVLDQLADIRDHLPKASLLHAEVETPWARYYLDNGSAQFKTRLKDGQFHRVGATVAEPQYAVYDKKNAPLCQQYYVNDLYVVCAAQSVQ